MSITLTATISTRNRYHSTLPLAMLSIAESTLTPDKFILFDDNEKPLDIREIETYRYILNLFDVRKIKWEVIFGEKKGQVANHQRALEICESDCILRLDDDNILEPKTIETLVGTLCSDKKIGAVAGLVLSPNQILPLPSFATSKIENIHFNSGHVQWYLFDKQIEVDHLYSTFLFRKEAAKHGYCQGLSRIGHREETIFTYEMKRNGWKLIVDPSAITWHFRGEGGIRSENDGKYWIHDDEIFQQKLKDWGIELIPYKLIVLDCGIGDTLAFKQILPEIKKKFRHRKIVIACCYPEIFKDEIIPIISISLAKSICLNSKIDINSFNIYRYCIEHNWKGTLIAAYREMYISNDRDNI